MALTQRFIDPEYAAAAKIFEAYATADAQAQLTVYVGGKLVLDLASNIDPDALTTVYSVSKSLGALAMAKLVERGQLDLDQRVAHYWPEFAAKGKQDVTVRQLLSHQAGLPEADDHITDEEFLDGHAAAAKLAAQRPFWAPGKAHGYHSLTIGPLMSELCFRITGQTVQQLYEAEIRSQAGSDAYLGLPPHLESRVAELLPGLPPTAEQIEKYALPKNWRPGPVGAKVNAYGLGAFLTSAVGRANGLSSAAGVASARGLAKTFQWATGFGGGQPGVASDVLDQFAQLQVYGLDLVLDHPTRAYGVLFMKPNPMLPFGSYRAFGHDGAGGAIVIADPVGQIVLGYTLRRVEYPGGMDPRLMPVIDAIRAVAVVGEGPQMLATSR